MIGNVWMKLRSRVVEFTRKAAKRKKPRRNRSTNSLLAEQLESRHLLAANTITFENHTSSIVIEGTSEADDVRAWSDASQVYVRLTNSTGTKNASFDKSTVSMIRFTGAEGDDHFNNSTDVASRAWGDDGNDVLIGGSGNDQFYGGIGNDSLSSGDGDDSLYGEDGHDQLSGGGGADRLEGGAGNDRLEGGADGDILIGGDDNDSLYGGDGNDRLLGQAGLDRLEGGNGNDQLFGGTEDDLLVGGSDDDQLYGEEGNDRLIGQGGADRLEGGAGNDRLEGGTGDDLLIGGEGDDELYDQGGNDRLLGQDGNDKLLGGDGNDQLVGGAGNDLLVGENGDDQLSGDDGDDRLFGGNGADRLDGGAGIDWLEGGEDDDVLIGGDGNDDLFGHAGNDRLSGGAGNDKLMGNSGDDQLFGGTEDDLLVGGDGNDELVGDDGADRLLGQAGIDRLDGSAGNDRLEGGDGDDALLGGDGDDELWGNIGDDVLWGQNGNDKLIGGGGNVRLYGGDGDDLLVGGSGNDQMYGNNGNDRLLGNGGNDLLDGGDGNDRLESGDGDDSLIGGNGFDELYGDAGNDKLWGSNDNDKLIGGTGDDELRGGAGDDTLLAGEGNDGLHGEDGNDELYGEAGNDALDGGAGNDIVGGGDGDDTITGGTDHDLLFGGGGKDALYGQAGDDLLIGGYTIYDQDRTKLEALRLAWTAEAPYASRVAALENDEALVHLISTETVFEDGIADQLFGGDGQDWFIQTGAVEAYVPHDVAHEHDMGMDAGDVGHTHGGPIIIDHLPIVEGFDLVSAVDNVADLKSDEALHSKMPHMDSANKQREHLSLFQLVRYDQVTHYAVQDGAWSNPATWHDGIVPGAGARVLIPHGIEVEVDKVVSTRLGTIRVDGKLSFNTSRNTELRVDTVAVSGSGTFEMGTEDDPIRRNVRARLVILNSGAIDRAIDPFALGRGLISHGAVSIVGSEVTSYVALASPPAAGSNMLALSETPIGWKIGDKIVIAGVNEGTEGNEERQIIAISGSIVFLNLPLAYDHIPPSSDFAVHVANVTRNAVIESESTSISRRGHVMFMHSSDVNIAYAGFYKLGRTNKKQIINDSVVNSNWKLEAGTGTNPRARYAVHFHRTGTSIDDPAAQIRGSAVVDAPGWGFVNHSSHVDMLDNVAFDVQGAAFSTEVGDEIGSFRGNIAIGTKGTGESINNRISRQDFGHQGDGFWFQGGGVDVTGNVSAGNDGHAFAYYTRGLVEGTHKGVFRSENLPDPSIAGGEEFIDVGYVPVFEFKDNIGYASETGLAVRYQLLNVNHNLKGVFEDSLFWNNTLGVNLAYTHQVVLRDLTVAYGTSAWPLVGIQENVITKDIVYDNLTVTGYNWGINVGRVGYSIINGGYFANKQDIVIESAAGPGRTVLITGNVQFAPSPTQGRIHVLMRPVFDGASDNYSALFYPDVVTLNYGPYSNQRLYYDRQAADATVFTEPRLGLPGKYVGLTNQELLDEFGIALGGAVAPSNAQPAPNIVGLLAP